MTRYISSSYRFKLPVLIFILPFFINAALASPIMPNTSIVISADDTKLCLGETTTIYLSSTQIGVEYKLKDNNSGLFVANTLVGNNSAAHFEPILPLSNSSYTVVATHIASSESTDLPNTVAIEVLPLPNTDLEIQPSHTSLCVGEGIDVEISNSETDVLYRIEGGSNINEDFFPGNGSKLVIENFEPFRSTTYRVTAVRKECQTAVSLNKNFNIDVRFPPETKLFIYSDKSVVCEGEDLQLSLFPTDPTVDYQLHNEENQLGPKITGNGGLINFNTVNPFATKTYTVQAHGHYCIKPVKVDFDLKVDVHTSPETDRRLSTNANNICKGEALTVSVENSQQDIIYQLHDGTHFLTDQIIGNGGLANFPVVYPESTNTFFVYAYDLICPEKIKLKSHVELNLIKPESFPIENFATPGEVCEGETVAIELPLTQTNVTYHLYDNDTSVERIKSDGGSIVFDNLITHTDSDYKILVDDCTHEVIAAKPKLKVHSNPITDWVITNEKLGLDGKIDVIVTDGQKPFTYIFENYKTLVSDKRHIELDEMKAGDYKLAVVDANFCKSTDIGHELKIDFTNSKEYTVNGILTPNGDGRNDNWVIRYNPEWKAPEVSIFNIYGQKVFHSLNYQNDWKGTYNNAQLPNGSYFYLIEFHRNKMKPIKGIVSILGRN